MGHPSSRWTYPELCVHLSLLEPTQISTLFPTATLSRLVSRVLQGLSLNICAVSPSAIAKERLCSVCTFSCMEVVSNPLLSPDSGVSLLTYVQWNFLSLWDHSGSHLLQKSPRPTTSAVYASHLDSRNCVRHTTCWILAPSTLKPLSFSVRFSLISTARFWVECLACTFHKSSQKVGSLLPKSGSP